MFIAIAAANINPDLFGDDAEVFRPDRWLDGSVKPADKLTREISVYSSLQSFIGGARGCIGVIARSSSI